MLDTRNHAASGVKEFTLCLKIDTESKSTNEYTALVELPHALSSPGEAGSSSITTSPSPSPRPKALPPCSQPVTPVKNSSKSSILDEPVSTGSLPDAESPSVYSESESIIVQNNLHRDAFLGDDILPDPFCDDLPLEEYPGQGKRSPGERISWVPNAVGKAQLEKSSDQKGSCQGSCDGRRRDSLLPRKRSAKTASLPDSVTDSERGYGGCKKPTNASRSQPTTSTKSPRQRSLIPRPPLNSSTQNSPRSEPSKTSLTRADSAPELEASLRRLENELSPLVKDEKEDLRSQVLQNRPRSLNASSLVTPSKPSRKSTNGDGQGEVDLEKLSTVAVVGSPCDLTGLSGELDKVSSINGSAESGEAWLVRPSRVQTNENHLADDGKEPRLIWVAGRFYLVAPKTMESATYQAKITLSIPLQEGRPGWHELVVPGLPRLGPNEPGYVFFRVPRGHGLEFRTTQLKHCHFQGSYLMSQMIIPSRLILPMRFCDATFFGYLKDFNVIQAIRADILQGSHKDSFRVIRYHAICSINMIHTNFWAERCGFRLYIHGGPEGEFFCPLEKEYFQEIHLEPTESEVGISRVHVVGCRSNLEKFSITWDMKLSKGSPLWIPRIKANCGRLDIDGEICDIELDPENDLREDYLQMEEKNQVGVPVEAKYQGSIMGPPLPQNQSIHRLSDMRYIWHKYGELLLRIFFVALAVFISWMVLRNLSLEKQNPMVWRGGDDSSLEQLNIFAEIEPDEAHPVLQVNPEIRSIPRTVHDHEHQSGNRRISPSLRDRLDYFLGWRGPLGEF